MSEIQEKHNYLYNSLDDASNLAGFTADDLDVVDQIKAVANSAKVILIFAKNIENLSDFAYWRLLSYIWINGGYEIPCFFRKMFKMPIPNSNEVMLDEEYHFFKMLPKVITCYRVHHTNHEKYFLSYTLSPSKAVIMAEEFQRNNSFAGISEYKVNKSDVFAVFTRHWEDEILVLDRSKVRFERKVEV